ncbi:E3 ubiquitin-protein ligase TRIM71-like [Mytilus californianus]|uniref:E3 ubiquitin-protein ligase TRIM71-like n=1 Tax=Mytilus californianus TaxID=6549 RepID=UPI002246A1E5|nr:E3 ubiquitin-protein ligase TRIM71-like [Mytilus californianus]
MASKSPNMFCGTCSRRSKSTKAVKYCTDCEDALCSECLDVHGTIKACASHHVIDVNVIDGSPFIVNKFCAVHPVMVLELFCSDHDTLCCRSCMASHHRSCDKLLPIEVAAKGVKTSTMYEEINTDVHILNTAVNELEDKKRKGMLSLNDSTEIVQQDVKNLKGQLQKRIQETEAALMSEIDKIHTNLSKESSDDLDKICDQRKKIQNISEQFLSVTKHGSECQIFMFINNIKKELNCQVNDFQELLSSQKDVSLSFKESDLLIVMKSFGSVEMKEASLNIKCKPLKGQQAQKLQQQRKIPTQFKLDAKFKVAGASIAAIGVTKDNRLFLCNQTSRNLYVMSDTGQQFATIQMNGTQWGIAIEEEKNLAWITLPGINSIQTVNIVTMTKGQPIKLLERCYGIALIDDQIAVGGIGKIHIIGRIGNLKKTLDVGEINYIYSISVWDKQQLYYAQLSKLKCVGLDGTVTSISTEDSYQVIDVKQDRIGNAYLLEYQAANFKLFSFENKSIKTILTKKDGLNNPYGFAFSKDFSKLFISNYSSSKILVFLCK